MAIGPDVLKTSVAEEAKKFESLIDELLKAQKMYTTDVTITPPPGMSTAHLDILKPAYLKAGWKSVTWDSQRNGDSITFSIYEPTYNQWDR